MFFVAAAARAVARSFTCYSCVYSYNPGADDSCVTQPEKAWPPNTVTCLDDGDNMCAEERQYAFGKTLLVKLSLQGTSAGLQLARLLLLLILGILFFLLPPSPPPPTVFLYSVYSSSPLLSTTATITIVRIRREEKVEEERVVVVVVIFRGKI